MSVVVLLHLDGTNGSTTFTDSSAAPHTFTAISTAALTTSQAKFGTASLDCSGSTSAGISTPDSADWTFGSGQFTVEAWIRWKNAPSAFHAVASQWSGSQNGWWLGQFGANFTFFYSLTGGDANSISAGWSPSTNTWYHVAVDRNASNVLRLYIDGSVIASGTVSSTFFNSNGKLTVGNEEGAGTRSFPGYIDEVRIDNGTAQYGGAFTPPTGPFGGGSSAANSNFLVF